MKRAEKSAAHEQEKQKIREEIHALRLAIKAADKIPQRIVNGSWNAAHAFKDDHQSSHEKVDRYSYDGFSYSLNELLKKRAYLQNMLTKIT